MRIAIITTHPIQYYAPIFKLLHERQQIHIKVFYTLGERALDNYDHGFDKKITWDIPLLDGYPYEWVLNTSANPGSHHFKGIVNPNLINQVNNLNPDAILIFGWAYQGHLKAIRYFKNKIPVLFRGDSTLLDETGGIKGLFKSIFLRWVYRHIDCAFYTGINNKAYFKKYGLKESQLSFAPHAIDNERFSFERKNEVALLRQNLGLMPDDLLVLFAGKLEEKKDPILLHDAFISLKNHAIHLLFVGDGVLKKQLKAKAQYYNNIHFMDFQNQTNMPVMYQSCDLFCLPSKGPAETWGLAVNEAMACSKAILVSDKCGCAIDLVKTGKNGAIFQSENSDDLISCLKQLTKNKETLINYGKVSGSVINSWNFLNIAISIENKLIHETH
ncbi:MAG: glycosyl transferase family 1 [Mucilaginibacter sp.]|nr:glycosyl transferase family 1 [Mucilaginibacter sp.]